MKGPGRDPGPRRAGPDRTDTRRRRRCDHGRVTKRVAVIYPEAETSGVERFRRRWDPLGGLVAAHVTIAFPFEWERGLDELRDLLAQTMPKPFALRLDAPTIWDDEYLFLLADRGGAEIARLHEAVHNTLGLPRSERFVPHMTVGRRPPGPDQDRMVRAATGLAVNGWARTLSVYRREPDGTRVHELTVT
jgi:2'-5' RNA ligase